MIGQGPSAVEGYATPIAVFSGVFVLLYLVARHMLGKPLLAPNPKPFRKVDAGGLCLAAFGLYFGQQACGVLLLHVRLRGTAWGWIAIALGLAFAFLVYVYAARKVLRPRGNAGARAAQGLLVVWASLPVVYGALLVVSLLGGVETTQKHVQDMAGRRPGWQHLALFAVLVAPLVEEIAFRGLLYPAIRSRWGVRAAVIVTSVLFGLIHVKANVVMPLALLGVFLAYLVEATGSILPCIVGHLAFNLLTVLQLL